MQQAFGFPIGIAAQVRKNQPVMTVKVNEENILQAKEAIKKAPARMPGRFTIVMRKIN